MTLNCQTGGLKARNKTAQGNALGKKTKKILRPERASHNVDHYFVLPLQGKKLVEPQTQGVALGYLVIALSARRALPVFFALVLAAGCATHKEKIVFSDEAEVRAARAGAIAAPVRKSLDKADEQKIEQKIFAYLLERHFWDLADYSAVFLQAEDAQVKALMKQFPDHVPPIKLGLHASLEPHRTPLDKDTRKPAMILSVEVNEPNADDSVDAIGRWYAGDAVTGFRAFNLKKADDDWQISAVK